MAMPDSVVAVSRSVCTQSTGVSLYKGPSNLNMDQNGAPWRDHSLQCGRRWTWSEQSLKHFNELYIPRS